MPDLLGENGEVAFAGCVAVAPIRKGTNML
jgi:hypothetical protein